MASIVSFMAAASHDAPRFFGDLRRRVDDHAICAAECFERAIVSRIVARVPVTFSEDDGRHADEAAVTHDVRKQPPQPWVIRRQRSERAAVQYEEFAQEAAACLSRRGSMSITRTVCPSITTLGWRPRIELEKDVFRQGAPLQAEQVDAVSHARSLLRFRPERPALARTRRRCGGAASRHARGRTAGDTPRRPLPRRRPELDRRALPLHRGILGSLQPAGAARARRSGTTKARAFRPAAGLRPAGRGPG